MDPQCDNNEPRTFLKMLSILDAFTIAEPSLTTAQIAKRCNISSSSIYRYLSALENHDYLSRDPETGKYMIGLKMVELSGIAMVCMDVRYRGQIILDQLSTQLGMNSNLSVLYKGDILHIAFSVHTDLGTHYGVIGRRTPAHCTAMGKVLLASVGKQQAHNIISTYGWRPMTGKSIQDFDRLDRELDAVCAQGFATEDKECSSWASCIAYPVVARNAKVVAAISVSNYSYRLDAKKELVNHLLREHAQKLSYDLGYFGPYPFIL